MQSCWIMDYTDKLCSGRCAGGWYDALDCSPDRFLLQAYYSVLGGAKESLIHCYDYLIAEDPGRTPYGDQSDAAHLCAESFASRSKDLTDLADFLYGARIVSFNLNEDNVSTHIYRCGNNVITVVFDANNA